MNRPTSAPPSAKRLDLHYIAMQIGFWAMFAGICAYQAALLGGRGFTHSQVGAIIAVRCLAGIACQPILGGFADRHPGVPLKWIVSLSLLISWAVGFLLFVPGLGLGGTLVVFAVLGGFEISAYPLMDAMAIQFMNAGVPIRYSLGRGIGSMAYAVVCALLGLQVGQFGLESTLITHAALVLLEIILVATYPPFHASSGQSDRLEKPQSAFSLLKSRPRFTLMLLGVLCGITAVLPMSNFLVNIITSRGGDDASLGGALFLMAAFEMPTAFFFQKLLRKFGSARLLCLSMVFCALKIALLLCAGSFGAVLLAQPLQMLGYGLFTPASVYFVNESVPPADRVRGQTIMMVASNGLGGVLGSFLAGAALDRGGASLMLSACLAIGVLGVILTLLAVRMKSREPGQSAT